MSQQQSKPSSNASIITFVVVLSLICALILSVLASALEEKKEIAKELDRSKQMMIAARIYTHEGYFQIQNEKGEYVPAKFEEGGLLVPGSKDDIATQKQLIEVYKRRLNPLLVNNKGEVKTFEKAGIDEKKYIQEYRKGGYYKEKWKLIYEILPNQQENQDPQPIGYMVPVNGFGLWDAIYGYIAIEPDGNTVIGISWYDQKETPGLGANITEASWQNQFHGKHIFQAGPSGETEFKSSPIGIIVVKGKVQEALGDSPKTKSAVDGMPGATLTGNGVEDAYKKVLGAYRPFFVKLHKTEGQIEVGMRQ